MQREGGPSASPHLPVFRGPSRWEDLRLQDPCVKELLDSNLRILREEDSGRVVPPSWFLLVGPPATGKTWTCSLFLQELKEVYGSCGLDVVEERIVVPERQGDIQGTLEWVRRLVERLPRIEFSSLEEAEMTEEERYPPSGVVSEWKTLYVLFIDEIAQLDTSQQEVLGEILRQAKNRPLQVMATCNQMPSGSTANLFTPLHLNPLTRNLATDILRESLNQQRVAPPEEGALEVTLGYALAKGGAGTRDDQLDMRQVFRNMTKVYRQWFKEHTREEPVPIEFVEEIFSQGVEHQEEVAIASLVLGLELTEGMERLFHLRNSDVEVVSLRMLHRIRFFLHYPSDRLLERLRALASEGPEWQDREFSSVTLERVQLSLCGLKATLERSLSDFEDRRVQNSWSHLAGTLSLFLVKQVTHHRASFRRSFPASEPSPAMDPEVLAFTADVLRPLTGQR